MLLQELAWPAVRALPRETPVIIPIAAVEQHGHHMPLYTDSMLLGEIVRRVEQRASEQVLVAPLMWLGNSHHHLDFAGTLSCEPRVYLDLLVSLLDNLIGHGFQRLLMLNGHGGNDVPGKQAVFEVRQRYRSRGDLLLLFTTYWSLGGRPWETMPEIQQKEMGHACEWETSMMLRISPRLVGDYRAVRAVPPGDSFLPATRGWVTQERSEAGHIGWPQLASAEKGEHLLVTFSDDVERLIERMLKWDGRSWEG
ncbi:creatininase family protein [Candidatus Laterigemmans baculatus]|uniref:creatininase family protein n=1 Tax=Candidatus Laterigemmans baculatus TaxID=2770505 RepID=UPI0013DC3D86|nr:creatininase family protein [Candidatus Laterigemmans baculatus]